MKQEPLMSVVMAVRNERGNIEPTVKGINELEGNFELIFVEGHSSDGTFEEIKIIASLDWSYPIKFAKQDNVGKKDALLKGFEMAVGEILLMYDLDGEIPISEIGNFYKELERNENLFVLGNRFVAGRSRKIHPLNWLGNLFFALAVSFLTGRFIRDALLGIKGFWRQHYLAMRASGTFDNDYDRFAELDLIFGACRLGLDIKSIPARYDYRHYGETKVKRFRTGWQLLKRCFLEFFYQLSSPNIAPAHQLSLFSIMNFLKKIPPQILLFMLVVVLFLPVLFSTKLLPGFDPLLIFYPLSYHNLNQQGFWTKTIFSGFDTWALPASGAGNWLYYFLMPQAAVNFFDFITFYHVLIFFYVILALIFSYLAAKQIGFDKWVAAIVSSAYIFSAFNLSWMVNIGTGASLFIFPALVYFLLKFTNTSNWFWPLLGGVFLGLGLTMSHLQYALIAVFGGFLFALFLVFSARGGSASGGKNPNWAVLVAFIIIFSIGVGLSAFELMPEYRLTQFTARGLGLSFAQSQECAFGVFDFVRYLIPNFNFGVGCGSVLYIGVLPLILALLAILNFTPLEVRSASGSAIAFGDRLLTGFTDRKKILFWVFLLVFAILFSVKYSPVAYLFHYLPVWKSLRSPDRFVMLANFSWAVLAGFGFNWILENKNNFKEFKIVKWIKRLFFAFLSLIVAVNIIGLFKTTFIKWAGDYFDKYYYPKTTGLPIEHYHRVIENMVNSNFYAFSFFNKDFVIPFILTVAAFLTIIFIRKFNKITLFYVFLLSGFVWAVTSPMVSSGFTRDFFRETEIVRFLKEQEGTFRIYSLLPSLATYQFVVVAQNSNQNDEAEFLKAMLPVNLNLIYNLDSIDGLETSIPRRVSSLLSELLSERTNFGNRIAEARLKPEEKIKIFEARANILAMMNVKYIISAYPLDEKIFKKVFMSRVTRFNIPIFVYENRNILPRFYVVNRAEFVAADEIGSLENILVPGFNFKAATLIECEKPQDCGQATGRGEITDSEYNNGYLKLKTKFNSPGWIVFSESFSPYWSAKINNEPVSIYRANYVYQAVKVLAGSNLIEFEYKPKFFKP